MQSSSIRVRYLQSVEGDRGLGEIAMSNATETTTNSAAGVALETAVDILYGFDVSISVLHGTTPLQRAVLLFSIQTEKRNIWCHYIGK